MGIHLTVLQLIISTDCYKLPATFYHLSKSTAIEQNLNMGFMHGQHIAFILGSVFDYICVWVSV